MDHRPVAIGGLSGVASSLVVTLLRGLTQEHGFELPPNLPSCLEGTGSLLEEPPVNYFLAGLLCGVCLGPLVDLVWLWRQRWRRFILAQAGEQTQTRALHKVLA